LVEIFVTNGHVAQAFQLHQNVQARWPCKDIGASALSAFIQALCKARHPNLAIQAYDTAKAEGALTPKDLDLTSCGLLVKAQCEAGGLAAAVAMVEDVRKLGLKPDDAMVSPLLTACFREAQVKLGQTLFEEFLASGGRPNQVMLCTMVKLYGRCQKLQMALDLVELVKNRYNLEPSGPTFTALLQACVRNKQPNQALKIFHELRNQSTITLDASMYSTLIGACTQANMVRTGIQLAEEALQKSIDVPSDVLQNLVVSGIRRRPPVVEMNQISDFVEKYNVPIDDKSRERLSQCE
jgi:pentatricopeptide repeat protein